MRFEKLHARTGGKTSIALNQGKNPVAAVCDKTGNRKVIKDAVPIDDLKATSSAKTSDLHGVDVVFEVPRVEILDDHVSATKWAS